MGNLEVDDKEYLELLLENTTLKMSADVDKKINKHAKDCPKAQNTDKDNKITGTITLPQKILNNPFFYIVAVLLAAGLGITGIVAGGF